MDQKSLQEKNREQLKNPIVLLLFIIIFGFLFFLLLFDFNIPLFLKIGISLIVAIIFYILFRKFNSEPIQEIDDWTISKERSGEEKKIIENYLIAVFIISGIVVLILLTLYTFLDFDNTFLMGITRLFLPFILAAGLYGMTLSMMNKSIMKSFAKDLGFPSNISNVEIVKKESSCQLLNSGADRRIFNYIRTAYKDIPVEVYNYKHSFPPAKYEYVVFELKTKKSLPTAIVTNKNSYLANFLNKKINLITAEKLDTESNEFNKDFKVFLEKDHDAEDELGILEILTPNIIQNLIDEEKREKGKDIHIEFKDNTVLLYKSMRLNFWKMRMVKNKKDLKRLLNLSFRILEEVEK